MAKKPSRVAPASRGARFLRAVDTGRWNRGRPEQIAVFVSEYSGTLLLGLGSLVRARRGFSKLGRRKPDYWRPSTGTVFYNLADRQQLHALLNSLRHIAAYAAGLRKHPNHNRYFLRLGQRKTLVSTPLDLKPEVGVKYDDGFERVTIRCENANFRNPGHKVFARNPEVRKIATEEWRRRCVTNSVYTFEIERKVHDGYADQKGFTPIGRTSLSIPAEGAARVVEAVEDLLLWLWSYMGRHPAQAERRALPWNTRWQLHHPPAFDWLIPRLRDACALVDEPALFEHPELYWKLDRLQDPDARNPFDRFTPEYIERLRAYERQELRWRHNWSTHELQAATDLDDLNREALMVKVRRMYAILGIFTLLMALRIRRKRQARLSNWVFHPGEDPRVRPSVDNIWARGPPSFL